jgi:hypothetical protein
MGYPVGRVVWRSAIPRTEPVSVLPPLPAQSRRTKQPRRTFDVGLVFALAWLMMAVVLTVVWGADLGRRGMAWLVFHHLLCGVGCVHEIRRAWHRRQSS